MTGFSTRSRQGGKTQAVLARIQAARIDNVVVKICRGAPPPGDMAGLPADRVFDDEVHGPVTVNHAPSDEGGLTIAKLMEVKRLVEAAGKRVDVVPLEDVESLRRRRFHPFYDLLTDPEAFRARTEGADAPEDKQK